MMAGKHRAEPKLYRGRLYRITFSDLLWWIERQTKNLLK